MQHFRLIAIMFLWATTLGSHLFAQTAKDRVGFTQLANQLGPLIPTGAGVRVGLVEADVNGDSQIVAYRPDTNDSQFAGKSFFDLRPPNSQTPTTSSHATAVGRNFFGLTSSLSPGVTEIDVYEANDFVFFRQQRGTVNLPELTNVSVMNHSYIGNGVTAIQAQEINARLDYTIQRDNVTSVAGLNNGVVALPQLYAQSYNSIIVGRSDGLHSYGQTSISGLGRTKPDIVAPESSTSLATPLVSSAAVLLHAAAASSPTLVDARNSQVIKAVLMAGATKNEFPSWTNSTTRPLDAIYGAGELNVFNSYQILTGGQFEGSLSQPLTNSGFKGWDYQQSFDPAQTMFWNFQVDAGQLLGEASFLLTWNAVYNTSLNASATALNFDLSLANMSMRLFDSSNTFLGTELAASLSSVDNVEHIYLRNLGPGNYTLAINSDMATAFGLAWNLTAVPEPTSLLLVAMAIVGAVFYRRSRLDSAREIQLADHNFLLRAVRSVAVAGVVCCVCAQPSLAEQPSTHDFNVGDFKVGVARKDITPGYPILLNGFLMRQGESLGVRQRIWAKAVSVQQGTQPPLVLIAVDTLGIPAEIRQHVAKALEPQGVPNQNLAITATHTHSAPIIHGCAPNILGRDFTAEELQHINRYTSEFIDALVGVAQDSLMELKPARLSWAVGSVTFAKNRRSSTGPIDHQLPVLAIHDVDGKLMAVSLSYSCHCVTLAEAMISGDWAGYAQTHLEQLYPGCTALVSIGCAGDQNPNSVVGSDRVDVADEQGRIIAQEVKRILDGPMQPISGPLTCHWTEVALPLQIPTAESFRTLAEKQDPQGYHARKQLQRLERGQMLASSITYPIQMWSLGEKMKIFFLGGEATVEYGLMIKELGMGKSPGDDSYTWVNAYSNSCPCYIPSETILKQGGYEGQGAMVYYDQPGVLKPGLQQLILQAVAALLNGAV